jgi:hypothetical protein
MGRPIISTEQVSPSIYVLQPQLDAYVCPSGLRRAELRRGLTNYYYYYYYYYYYS